MRQANIPIFIPMQGCPFDCVFCDQQKITGQVAGMPDDAIIQTIETHLQTLDASEMQIRVAFFGGSFTALPLSRQEHYLRLVQPFLDNGKVIGIRLSTRPDYINEPILKMLKGFGVDTIELGIQSMDESVLQKSGRGHTATDACEASALIREAGFSLVLQMMPGLPGDTFAKTLDTTRQIIEMGAEAVRIYPTLVIKGTKLESLYKNGQFSPLSLEEAVEWCSKIVPLFENADVTILRVGLHPSGGLINGNELVAGPFHPAFGAMVYSRIWYHILNRLQSGTGNRITVTVHPKELNPAIGYGKTNRMMLQERFERVVFRTDYSLSGRNYIVETNG